MEVREAQAFLAVAEELNFGRAAERLHMAQPPLSRLIRHIESDLGALLFVRNTRHVSLTPQGEAVVDSARELVMLSQRIKEIVRRSQEGELGRVRIGFGEATVNSIVGQLAHHIKDKRPGIGLDLLGSHFSLAGMEKLLKGHLDLLVGRQDFLPDEVDSRGVAQERLLIALPDSHRLAQRDVLTLPDEATRDAAK
ncbi:LysR family transcriptional regulator [Streptomyces sp. NPDC002790]|uniref:LysR family transcriptional regulator n=1 Tax=Streptomyces sp. NPDC002790 TaxID=3154431 RepID=UPI00331E0297